MSKAFHYWLPLFAYCGLIFVVSSFSKPPFMGPLFVWGGKLLHMGEYSILGFLSIRAIHSLNLRSSNGFMLALSVIFCVFYGFSDEIHQSFVPGRTVSIGDLMADGVGGFLGTLAYWKMAIVRKPATPVT
jgi:VanZ family protein